MTTLLRWLPSVIVNPEVSCEDGEADIFVHLIDEKVVVELLANERHVPIERRSSFLGHCKRAKEYSESWDSCPYCVVHFVETETKNYQAKFNANALKMKNSIPNDSNIFSHCFYTRSFDFVEIVIWKEGKERVVTIFSEGKRQI